MKRMKKWTAVLLTFALTVLSCAMPEMTSRADALSGEMYVEEQQEGQNAAEKLEDGVSSEQRQPVVINPNAGQGEEWLPVATDADATDPSQVPMVMSLLGRTYTTRYFVLSRFPDVDIKAVPIKLILQNASSGGRVYPIEVADDQKILINLYEQKDGEYHLSDEFKLVEMDGTVDLSVVDRNQGGTYVLELIVGNGSQLDYNSDRYKIHVIPEDEIRERLTYYTVNANRPYYYSRITWRTIETRSDILQDMSIPVTEVAIYSPEWQEGDDYYIDIRSDIAEDAERGINVKAYLMSDFVKYYEGEVSSLKDIDDKEALIYSHNHWTTSYKSKFVPIDKSDPLASDNFFCLVYTDEISQEVIGYEGIAIVMQGEPPYTVPTGDIHLYDIETDKSLDSYNVYTEIEYGVSDIERVLSYSKTNDNGMNIDYPETHYRSMLNNPPTAFIPDAVYYYSIDYEWQYSSGPEKHISKVVRGWHTTIEEVASAEDITNYVMRRNGARGYKLDILRAGEWDWDFTILYDNGQVQPYTLVLDVEELSESEDEKVPYLSPVVNASDPYFRMQDAVNLATDVYENNSDRTFDTLYGYGYQTVFIDDTGDYDLSSIIPRFWTCSDDIQVYAESASGVRELQKSGETVVDFSHGPVLYTIVIDGEYEKNYWVTFVKKEDTPTLYVNYPSDVIGADENKRTIYLTDYFDNRHDILIANVGKDQLTGLNVELSEAKNVKLDGYWTLGGEGNNTLSTDRNGHYIDDGNSNLAKIRLVPDGEGEISGFLTISADGQESVTIRLTGVSSNPDIIGTELSDPILYVPYSNVVATSNMLGTNIVTFSIEDGELPPGLALNPRTGEISGVPTEMGTYTFSVKASYSQPEFLPSFAEITLEVKENTDEDVYLASTEGYGMKEHIGIQDGEYGFVLEEEGDQLFVSEGDFAEFSALYLNGEKLVEGTDYTKESGSTRMVIRDETFQTKARRGGQRNTIAAEFRKLTSLAEGGVGTDGVYEMNVTSQNFRIEEKTEEPSKPDEDKPEEDTPKPEDKPSEEDTPKPEDKPSEGDVPKPEDTPDYGNTGNSGSSVGNNTSSKAALVNPPLIYNGNMSLYSDSFWIEDETGWWYRLSDGTWPAGRWCYLPYRGAVEWYYFDENGYMATGWFTDTDGNRYYLSPVSDGLKGHMVTGWQQIDGEWYYFKEESDGSRGSLQTNTWIGEYYVNQNGIWKE